MYFVYGLSSLTRNYIYVGITDNPQRRIFADGYVTESHTANGFYAFDDFLDLGVRAGLPDAGVRKEIAIFSGSGAAVADLVSRSFLRDDMKKLYLDEFQNKLKRLSYSFKKQL
jgi:serine/threonine-protein kinase HipA